MWSDIMSWEKIFKAPPRPSNEDNIPRSSKYYGPRWITSVSDQRTQKKEIDIKVRVGFEAFTVNAKEFRLYEDLSSISPEKVKQHLEANVGVGKLKWRDDALINMEGYLASQVLEVYEQMMDDIYDDFEVWSAYAGFKFFELTYHQDSRKPNNNINLKRPLFGGDLYHSAKKIDEWKEMAQSLMNSRYPAINARVRTTITNLLNGLNQLQRQPIVVLNERWFPNI
jgi:hypothetical protein